VVTKQQRFLKIAVTDRVYYAVTAHAADEGVSASSMMGELVSEALVTRSRSAAPTMPSTVDEEELVLLAGAAGMSIEAFIAHLVGLGREAYCDEQMVAGEPWVEPA
jgi:hypothetical protein